MRNIRQIALYGVLGASFLIVGSAYGEEPSLFEPDGLFMMRMDTGFRMGYIAGYARAKQDLEVECPVLAITVINLLKGQNALSKSFSESDENTIARKMTRHCREEKTYQNMSLAQLLQGIEQFYGDPANMSVTTPNALEIVKSRTKGEGEDYIKCITEYHRMVASATDKLDERLFKKHTGCLALLQKDKR